MKGLCGVLLTVQTVFVVDQINEHLMPYVKKYYLELLRVFAIIKRACLPPSAYVYKHFITLPILSEKIKRLYNSVLIELKINGLILPEIVCIISEYTEPMCRFY